MDTPSKFPRHLRRPGDDGYRTPTIEDVDSDSTVVRSVPIAMFDDELTPVPTVVSRYRRTYTNGASTTNGGGDSVPVPSDNALLTGAPLSLIHSFPSRLSWKERLKHFTWAYFTLTMATGGLANVLYSGMSLSCLLRV